MEKGNKKKLVQGVMYIIIFVFVFFATKYMISYRTSTEDVVKEISNKMNKKCPLMLNSDVRLDKVDFISVQERVGLVYVCTLIYEDINTINNNCFLLDKKTKLVAQKDYNSNPEIEYLRENNLIIYYVCYDKNKSNLFGFEITNQKR